jgi:hypothetical protein
MVTATVGMAAVLFVFTVGPWAYGELAGESGGTGAVANPVGSQDPVPPEPIDPATQAAAAAAAVGDPGPQSATSGKTATGDLGAATKALGIGETNTGEPNLDSLLDKKLDD